MAKGTADKGSDYDLLIISKANIPKQEKGGWRSKLDAALVYALNAPVDIILNSEEEVERKKIYLVT
jgi:predicted nucleotidyltransferase